MDQSYKIVRHFFQGNKSTVAKGLTLEQAQAHCQDLETSSSTCTGSVGTTRTRLHGPWFDSYTVE